MTIREGQGIGGLVVLVVSLAVYWGMLFHDRHPHRDSPLPWGDQGAARIAVEVRNDRGAVGIYFLPQTTAAAELSKILSHEALTADHSITALDLSSASAISISEEGGVLKIVELSAAKKLALGLPIDLNRATEEELMLVPGIGEGMAARIVETRQTRGKFGELADLTTIPGIKERKLRQLEKYLMVGNRAQ